MLPQLIPYKYLSIFLTRSIWPLDVGRVKDFGHREPNEELDRCREDGILDSSIVFRDLSTTGCWPVLSFRFSSLKSSDFNRRGRGWYALPPYRRNNISPYVFQLMFSLSQRFWVLIPSGQRTLVRRLDVLFAVMPHDLQLKGLSQLILSKIVTHYKTVIQNTQMVTRSTVRDGSLKEITLFLYSMQRHPSTVEVRQQPTPVAPSAPSAEPSRVPPPRHRPTVALGSPWPKS